MGQIENFVYGAAPPCIDDLRVRAEGAHLAIVVFASEYRPALGTVHRKHANMCYSRTGVARVGTREAKYPTDARGYPPFVAEDRRGIRAATWSLKISKARLESRRFVRNSI
jgi:hypothetical protein